MPQVTILRRERVEITGGDGLPVDATQVVYSTATVPPGTVVIENPDPTDDEVTAAIRADIAARAQAPGVTLDL